MQMQPNATPIKTEEKRHDPKFAPYLDKLHKNIEIWKVRYAAYVRAHRVDISKAAAYKNLDARLPRTDDILMVLACNLHHQDYLLNRKNEGRGSVVEYSCGGCNTQNYDENYYYETGPKGCSNRCSYCGRHISWTTAVDNKDVDFLDIDLFNIEATLPVGYALAW